MTGWKRGVSNVERSAYDGSTTPGFALNRPIKMQCDFNHL